MRPNWPAQSPCGFPYQELTPHNGVSEANDRVLDANDIYYTIRNFPGGVVAFVQASWPLLDVLTTKTVYLHISDKFRDVNEFAPTCSVSAPLINGNSAPSGRWAPGSKPSA